VFLKTSDYLFCLDALARLLGPVRLQYLLLFLAFVRAAHYWTETHPEIAFEDDIDKLLATHEALTDCILNDPQTRDTVTQSLLDELPALRLQADKAIGLLAAIVDSSDDAIVSKTLEGIITSWNAGAERLFGYTASEAVGQHISLIIPINRLDEETVIIDRIKKGERLEHFDTVRVRKDRTPIDISLTISPLREASGKIIGASKIARDITERKRIERELRESEERYRTLADALDTQVQFRTRDLERRHSQLRELSSRLMESQDAERRHIARELHDSAGQTLVVLTLQLAQFVEDATHEAPQLAKKASEIEQAVQQLSRELRTTSYLLHPPLLDESGISSALRWYVQGLAERSSLEVDLQISENFGRLPSEMELLIFRLVQESLTNIHRHSGSKTALIQLEREENNILVKVEDNGSGMSPERLAQIQSQGTGVGIRGMRERVRHFHGDLVVDSDSLGTRVCARLPLKTLVSTNPSNMQQDVA
jgi:two-component system sensor histidine kinase UhpB